MNEQMLVQFETGTRVLDFSRANPSGNPGQEAAVARLDVAVGKARTLMDQEVTGVQAVHGSVLSRDEIREAITGMVRVQLAVAKAARNELSASAVELKLRSGNSSNMLFLAQAKTAFAKGLAHREVLEKYGLPAGFLDEFKLLLDQFEASLSDTNAGRRAHTGAHAYLESLIEEIMQIVRQLDALNTHRFKADPERRGAWKNARDVHWPNGRGAKVQKAKAREEPKPEEGGSKEPAA